VVDAQYISTSSGINSTLVVIATIKMPEYKLIYFNVPGRAELARLLFHYGGQEFEDCRFERSEWPQVKDKMPFLQVPVLEVDGQSLCQSNSIARYLARKFELTGKSDLEAAQADSYVDHIGDLINGVRSAYRETDPEKQKALYAEFVTASLVPHLVLVEKHLAANGSGHLVGDSLTWADIAYYGFLTMLSDKIGGESLYAEMPTLKTLVDEVASIPNIKKYVDSRPQDTV